MKQSVSDINFNPFCLFWVIALISAMALGMAFVAQYVFGLAPCNLCVIQRWPYGIIIALGIIGAFMHVSPNMAKVIMGLIGLTFLTNSAIAFYHSGVERLWWKSMLEGCNAPKLEGSAAEVLAKIQSIKEAVRCDEIPWADPIFGLSMANYNVIFCAGLGIATIYAAFKYFKA